MATYSMLSNGSRGTEVKKLQDALINAGYSVGSAGADGIYGNDTAAAVRRYQQANGLDVDGIAGNQTLGRLYGSTAAPTAKPEAQTPTATQTSSAGASPAANQPTASTQKEEAAPNNMKYAYDPATDTAYQQALAALQTAQKSIPTYAGTYDQQLQDIYDKIMNRDKFSYNVNEDALYQQYADQYALQGKMAMMDTMGQAAALTGGYGNSYAQNVGQQAYQSYLQQLNDVVPELYGMALDQYNKEGDALLSQYAMVGDRADDEYNKYMDSLNQYWQNVSFLQDQADNAYDQGYNNWYNSYQNAYQAERDKKADEQWQAEFDEARRQYDQEYALAQSKAASGGSGGSSGGSGGSSGGSGYSSGGYNQGDGNAPKKTGGGIEDFESSLPYKTRAEYYAAVGEGSKGNDVDDMYDQYIVNRLENWRAQGKLTQDEADRIAARLLF